MYDQLNQQLQLQMRDQAGRATRRLRLFNEKKDFQSYGAASGAMGKLAGMLTLYSMIVEESAYRSFVSELSGIYGDTMRTVLDATGGPRIQEGNPNAS